MRPKQEESPRTKQVPKLAGRMELASFIELDEKKFAQLIKEIEGAPLFQKLFPSKKKVTSQLVNQIITQANKSLSAQEIKQELAKRFDIQISRRSVNNYRRELKMPSSFKTKSPSRGGISKRCVIRNQI